MYNVEGGALLSALLLAASAGAAAETVTVTQSGSSITAANACVSFTMSTGGSSAGRMTSLQYRGVELLSGGYGYTDIVDSFSSGGWGPASGGSGAISVTINQPPNAEFADIGITHNGSADPAYPMTVSVHKVLRGGDCGYHEYLVYAFVGTAAKPSDSIGQLRTVLRADANIFNYHSSELYWNRAMPLPADVNANSGSGDLQDATFNLTPYPNDPYFNPPEWWYYTKYDYSSYEKNHVLHGIYGHGYGIWCIHTQLSKESWVGGPTKQSLMVHTTNTTPLILNEFFNGHYAQSSINLTVTPGWTKTVGPWFFYIDTAPGGDAVTSDAGYRAMWQDAVQYTDPELYREFYDELGIPGYTLSDSRATVAGRITIPGLRSMAGATVVLADNGTAFDRSHAGYQYWADVRQDGAYTIAGVRPGIYRLSAYKPGVFDDFHLDDVAVAAPSTAIPAQTWTPPSAGGTVVMQLGIPDRTAMEFNGGDNYKHYGLFNNEGINFPSGATFVFGTVSGAAPTSERSGWPFTHWRSYTHNWDPAQGYLPSGTSVNVPDPQIQFSLRHAPDGGATGFLTIAVASVNSSATLTVTLNGHAANGVNVPASSSSGSRSGAGGVYNSVVVPFPAADFVAGTNTLAIHSSQTPIQYDAMRLEIGPADATIAPQPDLTVSIQATNALVQGGRAPFNVTVANAGADASINPVTVAVTLPWSMTGAPAVLTGSGWNCGSAGHVAADGFAYECTRTDALGAGAAFPPIAVRAALLDAAPPTVQTCATVVGGADVNTVNDQACDISSVAPAATALAVALAKSGPTNARAWSISVSNGGTAPAYGITIDAVDVLPTHGSRCRPAVVGPRAFPIMLGTIAPGGSATGVVTLDFSRCPAGERFSLRVPLSSMGAALRTTTVGAQLP
jgi:rhamnogalacturonan endolyase